MRISNPKPNFWQRHTLLACIYGSHIQAQRKIKTETETGKTIAGVTLQFYYRSSQLYFHVFILQL